MLPHHNENNRTRARIRSDSELASYRLINESYQIWLISPGGHFGIEKTAKTTVASTAVDYDVPQIHFLVASLNEVLLELFMDKHSV